jgi:histidine ammonia-lyase
MDTNLSGLPPFLVEDGGVNSGFMIAQVTAAALASENKALAHPVVGRLAADVGQPGGPRQHGEPMQHAALLPMVENTSAIVAIELSPRRKGIDMRAPLVTSEPLQRAHAIVRECARIGTATARSRPISRRKARVTRAISRRSSPGATIA